MNRASELIRAEHREIERLFERYPTERNMGSAQSICQALERHTEMEEAVLYPELERVDGERYEDAVSEHAEAARLIDEIKGETHQDRISELVERLRQEVAHHIDDEESEDLPRMESVCGESRMDELGAEMERWIEERTGQQAAGGG